MPTGLATSTEEKRQSSPVALGRQVRGISAVPQDIQEESRVINETRHIHPDRVPQVQDTNIDVSDLDLDSSGNKQQLRVVQQTEQFVQRSRKERKQLVNRKQADPLSKTRSGKIPAKPLTKKQRQHLQSIAKPTIVEYLENRK